jgi:rRNA maturation RNase YbeY
MRQVEQRSPAPRWNSLSVILTDHQGMAPVHQACFGRPESTDVVSQAYQPVPPEQPGMAGEVVVNVEMAWEQRHRGGASRELALYLAHGCDHLGGGVDDSREERARMRRRELGWLRRAEALGYVDGLMPAREAER